MKIKIPEKIEVLGSTIDIIWDEDYCEKCDLMGSANTNHNTIILRKKYKNILLKSIGNSLVLNLIDDDEYRYVIPKEWVKLIEDENKDT